MAFHDTSLGDVVEHAVQALAADERRGPYVPALWTQRAGGALLAGQSVLQAWFPGVHSDIGGGYDDKGIGKITLDFMMKQAARHGLVIDPARPTPPVDLDQLPPQHESFDEHWQRLAGRLALIPEQVRAIGPTVIGPDGATLKVAGRVCLHPSLVNRLGQRYVVILDEKKPETREGVYQPTNVKAETLPLFG